MAILNFSDVLKNVGLDPKDVKLIRHALSDERFRECYKAGMAHEYTQHQKDGFSKGYSYWITFISDGGTYARRTLVIVSMVLCLIHRMYALPDYLTVKPWNTVAKWRFLICNMWIC